MPRAKIRLVALVPDGEMPVGGVWAATGKGSKCRGGGLGWWRANRLLAVLFFLFVFSAAPARAADIVTGLVAWWKFDETSGTTAKDSSGKGHTGTLQNIASPATATSGWNPGKQNGALAFDGANDYVSAGVGTNYFPLPVFSICAWIKSSGLAAGQSNPGILVLTYGLRLDVVSNGKFMTDMDNGAPYDGTTVKYGTTNLFNNAWHHICLTYNGTNRDMYVDGVNERSAVTTWLGTTQWSTNTVSIGRDHNNANEYWSGLIDDVRIYSRALTAADVLALYNNGGPTRIRRAVIRRAVIR